MTFDKQRKRLIVSAGTEGAVFINDKHGDVDAWYSKDSGERTSYTRCIQVIDDCQGGNALHIIGGGDLPPSEGNRVANGIVDMSKW